MDIEFHTGVFRSFKSKVKFHLGRLQIDVPEGSEVQFDGTAMVLGGVTYQYPELRSSIKAGWLIPLGGNISDYIPKPAQVSVRSAQGTGHASTAVQKDETYAGAIRPAVQPTSNDGVKVTSKPFNSTVVRDTEGDGRSVGPAMKRASATDTTGASSDGTPVAKMLTPSKQSVRLDGTVPTNSTSSEGPDVRGVVAHTKESAVAAAEETPSSSGSPASPTSDGAVVKGVRLSTASKRKVTITDSNAAAQEVNRLENMQRSVLASKNAKGKQQVSAVAGDTLEEVVPAGDSDNHDAVLAAKAKREARLQQVQASAPKSSLLSAMAGLEEEGESDAPVSPAPKATTASKATPKPATKVAAKPPKSVEDFAINGASVELAPGFRWDKTLHWKTRVKMALQHAKDPERLALIRGYEVPTVVAAIDRELTASPAP
jgi:hypothetical protein